MITASVVIYKNEYSEIEKVIKSSINSIIDILFIIDNSPTNDLKEVITCLSPKVEYIFLNKNIGYGAAHNIAIKESIKINSKYHIILNPDIKFESYIIKNISKFFDLNNDIGLVMPKIFYSNGETQYLCKLLPTPIDLLLRRFIPDYLFRKRKNMFELRFSGYNNEMEVPSLSGCFMFIRSEILSRIGGFDERYFMYLEDVDLCRRIGQIAKTCFYPYVSVYHKYEKGSYRKLNLLKFHIVSAIKYFNKWGWFFDKKRRDINKQILKDLNYK